MYIYIYIYIYMYIYTGQYFIFHKTPFLEGHLAAYSPANFMNYWSSMQHRRDNRTHLLSRLC